MQLCTALNSLSTSNNASKCSHKLCYGKISFITLPAARDAGAVQHESADASGEASGPAETSSRATVQLGHGHLASV